MTLGFPTVLIPALQERPGRDKTDLSLNSSQISWISSINLICVPLGCVFSGSFTSILGRRKAMQLVCVPIFASWVIIYYAQSVVHLYIASCLSGFTGRKISDNRKSVTFVDRIKSRREVNLRFPLIYMKLLAPKQGRSRDSIPHHMLLC